MLARPLGAEDEVRLMTEDPLAQKVEQFLIEQIDTVPHLEALLLIWSKRPKEWSVDEMAAALYIPNALAGKILQELAQKELLEEVPQSSQQYRYHPQTAGQNDLVARLDETYRRELIRVSRMIHSKAPSSLRDFARAFRLTKEKE